MILFFLHLFIALFLFSLVLTSLRDKNLLVPVLGILSLFLIHCFRSCLSCSLSDSLCLLELLLFWTFALWTLLYYLKSRGKR